MIFLRARRPLLALAPLLAAQLAHQAAAQGYALQAQPQTPVKNCGGLFAESCAVCTQGNGEAWCNADCIWISDECKDRTPANTVLKFFTEVSTEGVWGLANWTVTGAIMFCFALAYKSKVVNVLNHDKIRERGEDYNAWSERKRGLFDCFFERNTCLYTTFCTPLVAAKNYEVGRVCPFWPACVIMFIGMYSPLYCVTACIRTVWSGRLKKNMGYRPVFCLDFIYSLFCWPCEVGRESLEVDEAVDVEISCINVVKSTWVPKPMKEVVAEVGSCFGIRRAC